MTRRSPPPPTEGAARDTSIIAALRHRMAAKEAENKQLKVIVADQSATIELLYGQLEIAQQLGP